MLLLVVETTKPNHIPVALEPFAAIMVMVKIVYLLRANIAFALLPLPNIAPDLSPVLRF